VTIEKAKSFYDEIKVTDKCIFSNGLLHSMKQMPVTNLESILNV